MGLMVCLVTGHSPWGATGYRGSHCAAQRLILVLSFLAFIGHFIGCKDAPATCGVLVCMYLLAVPKAALDALFVPAAGMY